MNTRTAACAALLALAALTGCSDDEPTADPAACKTALEAQYLQAIAEGASATDPFYDQRNTPAACAGISDDDVRVYSYGISGRHILGITEDPLENDNDSADGNVSGTATPAP
ncbi:hypothetical protein [Streptomyces phaeofaciens]|uniref:hypothetical protein n=1 Tax=Streptomyces phaeofaciens TaxID=68254 RepID=UPI00367A0CEB